MSSPPSSFDVQLLTELQKFNLDVGSMNIGAFFSTQIWDLKTAHKKMGRSIFQEKVFHHTLFFIKEQFTWGHA